MPFAIPLALGLLSYVGMPQAVPGREVQLIGFGLVVGLDGTGSRSTFTQQVVEDMTARVNASPPGRVQKLADRGLKDRLGPCRRPADVSAESILRPTNCSAVMVTAALTAASATGDKVLLTVSCMDDATSLRGGVLMMTPLKGADGVVYVVGQGALSVSVTDGPARTATVQLGGLVERPVGGNGFGFTPPRIWGARGDTR